MGLAQLAAVLLLASTASAQVPYLYCPAINGITYSWNPEMYPTIYVQTTFSAGGTYNANMNCFFQINSVIAGRVIVQVVENSIDYYGAAIGIRTTLLGGYLADWNRLTYRPDQHSNFISSKNQLFISFTTGSASTQPGRAYGVRLMLTFLKPDKCPPAFSQIQLAGRPHCVGRPSAARQFQFGDAQRYCNLQRSNLLVADQNNVSSVLAAVGATEVWIGMTAEPSGSYSSFRWINRVGVDSRLAPAVICTGDCRPGSTTHRCVYAANSNSLMQARCSLVQWPLCFMPAGGTDYFFDGSSAVRASGALLAGAVALLWGLIR